MSTQILGKTVYVLGAGASCHTGAPLLKDFMLKARWLVKANKEVYFPSEYNEVFQWIDSLRGSSYFVEFALDNLEHLFSLADMIRQIDKDDTVYNNLKLMALDVLDNSELSYTNWFPDNHFKSDELYQEFLTKLISLNNARQKLHRQYKETAIETSPPFDKFEKDSIITFNYDLNLDYALISYREKIENIPKPKLITIPFDYMINNDSANKYHFKLLKLHGSINWVECKNCNDFQIILPMPRLRDLPGNSISEGKMVSVGLI